MKLKRGDLLYDIGQSAEVIYIVFNGLLKAEAEVTVNSSIKYPIENHSWEVVTTTT